MTSSKLLSGMSGSKVLAVFLSVVAASTTNRGRDAFANSLAWMDVLELGVGGRAFPDNAGNLTFARWPAGAEADLTRGEWEWGLASAGLFVQFYSNATAIHLNYTLRNANVTTFVNFPPIGYSGCDLYAWDDAASGAGDDQWRWVASVFNGLGGGSTVLQTPLWANNTGWPTPAAPSAASQPWVTRYRLHFPSYNGVLAMAVGVPLGASLTADSSWRAARAAVYLGTSITQGGITSRPGAAYVSRLSRALPAPMINLGLCGACRLEQALAKWVGAAGAPSTLVVDCTANMSPSEVATNTRPFIKYLRDLGGEWARVPIVLVEPLTYSPEWLVGDILNRTGLRAELAAVYASLVADGDSALHYVPTSVLEGAADAGEEFTYEGVHPMDRGHALIAEALLPILQPLVMSMQGSRGGKSTNTTPGTASTGAAVLSAMLPLRAPTAAYGELGFVGVAPPANAVWTDAALLGFTGRAFNSTPTSYNRLPTTAHGVVRDEVWSLSLNSAGIGVGFVSNSPWVAINLTLAEPASTMAHFAASGTSGADLYAYDAATRRYRFVAAADPAFSSTHIVAVITPPNATVTPGGEPVRWLLNLATYNTVARLYIGTASGYVIKPDTPFNPDASPIMWYGTSILQGGVAERVGEIHSSRVARALNREVYNFGFSGNGKMEEAVGGFLAAPVRAPAAFIIDCSWNMDAASIAQAAVPFVIALRAANVSAPIWLAEGLPFGRNWAVVAEANAQTASNGALADAYAKLRSGGDDRVFYMTTDALFTMPSVFDSATAAGLHANDAGFRDMAAAWVRVLAELPM